MNGLQINDGQQAFNDAIESGRLSEDPNEPNYAGRYMYMYTDSSGDQFKHCLTRKYLRS